ncbi:restriction endonuclease [Streptococcus oralis]|jgi:hypothetical protein|uniref:restriction endonuclease n=1 Tax=Streptococcus oralis TaxID=1303 RepID=UPI0020007E5C|nr:restriction endonuclease [Streptococcus oralis]
MIFFKKFFSKENTIKETTLLTPEEYNRHRNKVLWFLLYKLDEIYKKRYDIQGENLEKCVKSLYYLAGYDTFITPKNGENSDTGIDVIAKKDNETIFIQCKNYSINAKKTNIVGLSDIQKFNGINGANKKVFITTTFFQGTIKKEDFPNIQLIDRKAFFELIQQIDPTILTEYIFKTSLQKSETPIEECTDCTSGYLVNKYSEKTHSYFKGCTNYPTCKKIK